MYLVYTAVERSEHPRYTGDREQPCIESVEVKRTGEKRHSLHMITITRLDPARLTHFACVYSWKRDFSFSAGGSVACFSLKTQKNMGQLSTTREKSIEEISQQTKLRKSYLRQNDTYRLDIYKT